MARNPHFAVDDLSEAARAIARHGVELNRREKDILAEIRAMTGEDVATSSFNRYAAWYRTEMRRRKRVLEQTEVAVKVALEHGAEMTEGIRAELLQTIYEQAREGGLKATPPFLLGKLALGIAENQRKDRELALREQQHDLDRKKFEAMERKLDAVREKAAAVKEIIERSSELSEATKQSIRQEIYGLEN